VVHNRVVTSSDKKSPFAALAALRDSLPEGPRKQEPAVEPPHNPQFAEKVIVARSKKGRGGKVVTTITGVKSELDALTHELKKALGCGATVEDGVIVVQGDQTARVRAFLEGRGARKVIIGS